MSRRPAGPLLVALAATWLTLPSLASAHAWLPAPGDYVVALEGAHVGNGGHRFDDAGETEDFRFIEEARDIVAMNELGWKRWVSFRLGARLSSVTARIDPPPQAPGSPFVRSRTGLADLHLGMRFRLYDRGAAALALETNWRMPLGYERDVSPSLGDGLHHFSASLDAGVPIPAFQGFAQGSVGMLTRVDVRMNPMKATRAEGTRYLLYDADVAAWLGEAFLVAGRYSGMSGTTQSAGDLEPSAHAMGPEVHMRVDDHVQVFAGAQYTVSGRNAWKYNTYYLGLSIKQTRLHRLQGFLGAGRRP